MIEFQSLQKDTPLFSSPLVGDTGWRTRENSITSVPKIISKLRFARNFDSFGPLETLCISESHFPVRRAFEPSLGWPNHGQILSIIQLLLLSRPTSSLQERPTIPPSNPPNSVITLVRFLRIQIFHNGTNWRRCSQIAARSGEQARVAGKGARG